MYNCSYHFPKNPCPHILSTDVVNGLMEFVLYEDNEHHSNESNQFDFLVPGLRMEALPYRLPGKVRYKMAVVSYVTYDISRQT
jgi:hypothetical protein